MNPLDFMKHPDDLIKKFNEECDKAGMIDVERRVVFLAQAAFLAHVTGHKEGTPLDASKIATPAPPLEGLPEDIQNRMDSCGAILRTYPPEATKRIVEAASTAILRVYLTGAAFKDLRSENGS